MRWEKGKGYVEIEGGISSDSDSLEAVWCIATNLNWQDLPIEFRRKVGKNDHEGYKELKQLVSQWAKRNAYELRPVIVHKRLLKAGTIKKLAVRLPVLSTNLLSRHREPQSGAATQGLSLDCFVATAPRKDDPMAFQN